MAYNAQLYMPQPMAAPMTVAQPNWYYQPTQTSTQPVNGLVSVTGLEGAKAYQLPPNSSMPLFDANDDVLYVKTTDAAGYPTVRAFDFSERVQDAAPQDQAQVTREEFDALMEKVEALQPKPARGRKTDAE